MRLPLDPREVLPSAGSRLVSASGRRRLPGMRAAVAPAGALEGTPLRPGSEWKEVLYEALTVDTLRGNGAGNAGAGRGSRGGADLRGRRRRVQHHWRRVDHGRRVPVP